MDRRTFLLRAGTVAAVALLLRLHQLGGQPCWYDEAFSWAIASSPDFWAELLRENSPPLYYVLLRGILTLLGPGEGSLRLLSALAGTGFVIACMAAARRLLGSDLAALLAGLFAALAPHHVYYSQEARTYALLSLFLAWAWAALPRALDRADARGWLGFALPAWLACATHLLAGLALVPCAVLVLARRENRRRAALAFALVGAGAIALTAAWLLVTARHGLRTSQAWDVLQAAWAATPPALAIPRSLELFVLGGQEGTTPIFLKQLTHLEFPWAPRALGLAAAAGLTLAALFGPTAVAERRGARAFLAVALLGPLAVLWLISALGRPLYLVGRYDLVAFGAVPLLVGAGGAALARLRHGRILAPLVLLALAVPLAWKLQAYHRAPAPAEDALSAEVLDRHVQPGDQVVLTGTRGLRLLWEWGLRGTTWDRASCQRGADHFGCTLFPSELAHEVSARAVRPPDRERGSLEAVRDDARAMLAALPHSANLWLVVGNTRVEQGQVRLGPEEELLLAELQAGGLRLAPFDGGMSILRLRR